MEEIVRMNREAVGNATQNDVIKPLTLEAGEKRVAAEGALWERLGQLAAIEERLAGNRSAPTSPEISQISPDKTLATIFEADSPISFAPAARSVATEKE